MDSKKFKVIGIGGIGGYLLDPLCRYLNFSTDKYNEVTLIDGDAYERKNESRQACYEDGANKAQAAKNKLGDLYPKIHFKVKSEYLTDENIISSIRENDTVFLCVDNHKTRKLVSDRCAELENVTLISGGNGDAATEPHYGNVIVYIRKNGQDITPSLTQLHEKIANPTDENPGEPTRQGCEAQYNAAPQLLFTNLMVATTMLTCYNAVEKGKTDIHQVYMDSFTQRMRPTPDHQLEIGE